MARAADMELLARAAADMHFLLGLRAMCDGCTKSPREASERINR